MHTDKMFRGHQQPHPPPPPTHSTYKYTHTHTHLNWNHWKQYCTGSRFGENWASVVVIQILSRTSTCCQVFICLMAPNKRQDKLSTYWNKKACLEVMPAWHDNKQYLSAKGYLLSLNYVILPAITILDTFEFGPKVVTRSNSRMCIDDRV